MSVYELSKKELKIELEASLFAAYLLVPESFLINEINKIKDFEATDDKHLKFLANKFQVPLHVISFRITQVYSKKFTKTKKI